MDLLKELEWRGMIHDQVPGTADQFKKEMTTAYIGFDPTAESLHIGSLVPILLLVHLQKAGHKPIALVGGATGMVGDPSGKSEERNLLDEAQLQKNLDGIKNQLSRFLDFDASKANAAEMVNNYDWFKDISFIHFLRDVGKHVTVNKMMSMESVKKRFDLGSGISYTEFAYQLMQGYDFYWLFQNKNCKVQMGGSDQWGNILTGTELIRRKAGGDAFAFTCPLITKTDGTKFGKTEKGNVWLDANRTSSYEFYQFWLNATDADAEKWIKIFTFLPAPEIEQLLAKHQENPGARELQKKLAKEVTTFVHGDEEYRKAVETTDKLFANQSAPADTLSIEDLEGLQGVEKFTYQSEKLTAGVDVVTFLAETGIFPSKGEARKTVQGGGVSINRNKVSDISMKISLDILLHEKYLLVQKGKRNQYLVQAV